MEDLGELIYIIIALALSAFFSGMETAFVSSNKLRLELVSENQPWIGKMLSRHVEKPERFITTALVGNNITLVVFGILMAGFIEKNIPITVEASSGKLLIQTIITTLVVLVFGEFIPKVMFRLKSVLLLMVFIPIFQLFYLLLYPIVWVFMYLSKNILLYFFLHNHQDPNHHLDL